MTPGFYRYIHGGGTGLRVDHAEPALGFSHLYIVDGAYLVRSAMGWRVTEPVVGARDFSTIYERMDPPK